MKCLASEAYRDGTRLDKRRFVIWEHVHGNNRGEAQIACNSRRDNRSLRHSQRDLNAKVSARVVSVCLTALYVLSSYITAPLTKSQHNRTSQLSFTLEHYGFNSVGKYTLRRYATEVWSLKTTLTSNIRICDLYWSTSWLSEMSMVQTLIMFHHY